MTRFQRLIAGFLLLWAIAASVAAWWAYNRLPPASLGIVHTGDWDRGYATARGVWTVVPADAGARHFGRHTAEIQCVQAVGICAEATAILPADQSLLGVQLRLRAIADWSDEAIRYEVRERCALYTYEIDRKARRVTQSVVPHEQLPGDCVEGDPAVQLELVTQQSQQP